MTSSMAAHSEIAVIGNGIIGSAIAVSLANQIGRVSIARVGRPTRIGSATHAAAAMLNSFAEVDSDTLQFSLLRSRFELNKSANRSRWMSFLGLAEQLSGLKVSHGFGTFVINNTRAGALEDKNFDSIVQALKTYGESYEFVDPVTIPYYEPDERVRALRAVYLPNEGWVNPIEMLSALDKVISRESGVTDVQCDALRISKTSAGAFCIELSDESEIFADRVIVANGASMTKLLNSSGMSDLALPILYGVGVSIELETGELTLTNCIRTPNRGLACGLYSAPRTAATTLIGATNTVWDQPQTSPTVNNIFHLLSNTRQELNTGFDRKRIREINVGWRPVTEDLLPLIGETELRNFYIVNGMRRDGFHCSPVLADIMVDTISGRTPRVDAKLFRPRASPLAVFTRSESTERIVSQSVAAAIEHGFEPGHLQHLERLEESLKRDAEALNQVYGSNGRGIQPELFSYLQNRFKTDSPQVI